jgi:hypothetical protein
MRPQLNAINTSLNSIALRLVDGNEDGLDLDAGQELYKNSGLSFSSGQALDQRSKLDQGSGQDHAFRVRYGSREEILSLRTYQGHVETCREEGPRG